MFVIELLATLQTDNLLAPDPEDVKPGWLAFGIVILMGIALYFILRSFIKQLKRVDFEEKPDEPTDLPRE